MPNRRPILIVEDDETLRNMLTEYLDETLEFAVSAAASIEAADKILGHDDTHFDAVILDIGLPDGDGRDYCARLRRQGHSMPIIMLTGANEETDVVRGLDSGASDYVAKPFRASELLARLRAQLRIFDRSEQAVFPVGPYTFRPAKKLLQDAAKNRRIRLTDKETAVLKFLYRSDSGGEPADPDARGVGVQFSRHDAYAGDAHLPAAPEDRGRSGASITAGDRGRRLPPTARSRHQSSGGDRPEPLPDTEPPPVGS